VTVAAIPVAIAPLGPADWEDVAHIYAEGIATGDATFETEVPDWERWDRSHLRDHRFVGEAGARRVGWAALAPVAEQCVYAGVAEVSVYVAADARGHGVGSALLEALVASSEAGGLWTLQRADFRVVGRRERLGRLHGTWRDVLLMERRSRVVA
jgi:L-amino acid N-acyltransferase YncA